MQQMIRRHTVSFQHAFEGLIWAFRSQPNFRVHALCAFVVILVGLYVQLAVFEWVLLIFMILWVLTAELINTALEAMTDLISSQWHEQAKIAKDVSAAMVLVSAIGSLFVGALLFIPKFF